MVVVNKLKTRKETNKMDNFKLTDNCENELIIKPNYKQGYGINKKDLFCLTIFNNYAECKNVIGLTIEQVKSMMDYINKVLCLFFFTIILLRIYFSSSGKL